MKIDAHQQGTSGSPSQRESLRQILTSSSDLPVEDALRVSVGVVGELINSRDEGVVSPVLTPENVLVDVEGQRIVSVQLMSRGGEEGAQVASVRAVGALLLEMLMGRPPASGAEGSAQLPDLRRVRSDVPEDLSLLLYRMLDDDPDLRPQTLDEVRSGLDEILRTVASDGSPPADTVTPAPRSASVAGGSALRPQDDQALLFATTPFVGREREIATLQALLADPQCRLVTLVGPGGIGKSRLAFQVAEEMSGSFPDGVYFVPLEAVRSPPFIPLAIGNAIDFSFDGPHEPEDQLLASLREKHVLLVLDGFDRLVRGAEIVMRLLERGRGPKVLVTSRERLNLRAEQLFQVRGLDVATEERDQDVPACSSVRLFLESAARVGSACDLTVEGPHVLKICRLLEGIPLGIELAAGWTRALSCADIAREIGDDIGFLATDQSDVPARHRGIRATFDTSWALLSEEERSIVARLSVFRGGFTRESARQVAEAPTQGLATLVDKSLVRVEPLGRLHMHELLRQYLDERLRANPQELEHVQEAHAQYYMHFLEERSGRLGGSEQRAALGEIEEEIANIHAAWDWMLDRRRTNDIGTCIGPLSSFYQSRGWYRPGEKTFAEATLRIHRLTPPDAASDCEMRILRTRLMAQCGSYNFLLGRYTDARRQLQEGIDAFEAAGASAEAATAMARLAGVARQEGRYDECRTLCERALVICRKCGSRTVEEGVLFELGALAVYVGDYTEARRLFEEGLVIARELKHLHGEVRCLHGLGDIEDALGHFAEARELYEKALTISRDTGHREAVRILLGALGAVLGRLGDHEHAKQLYQELLEIAKGMGSEAGIARGLYLLGEVHTELGELDRAKALLEESASVYTRIGDRRAAAFSLVSLGIATQELGDLAGAEQFMEQGLQMLRSVGVPWGIGSTLCGLGGVLLARGDLPRAEGCFREALAIASQLGAVPGILWALVGFARVSEARGDMEKAIELLAFVRSDTASDARARAQATEFLSRLRSGKPDAGLDAAVARGEARTLEDLVAELLGAVDPPPAG